MLSFCLLISHYLFFPKEYTLKHRSLQDTKTKSDYQDSPNPVTMSNIALALQDEGCFQTTQTPVKSKEDIYKEICDETSEENMIRLQNIHLKATESRSVAWGNTVHSSVCSRRCMPASWQLMHLSLKILTV
jgi:hypothetical protein